MTSNTSYMENIELKESSIADVLRYGPVSHVDDDLLLIEDLSQVPKASMPRRNHDIIIGLCLVGESNYTLNTEEHIVRPDDALIIPNGQVIDSCVRKPGTTGVGIMMSPDFFQEVVGDMREISSLILFSRNHPVFRLSARERVSIMNYFRLIKEKVDDDGLLFRKDVVRHLVAAMICEIGNAIDRIQHNSEPAATRADAIFTDFIRLVEQNYKQERRVSWYGEQLCITPKYLSEMVKQVSRRTPNEWIDTYVTTELRVQLRSTTKSIKEIARDMNFPNQSFLGKYFKEHVGMSPMTYRKQ